MSSATGSELLSQPIARSLLFLSLPSVVAMFSQTAVSVAEVWYVGRLGTENLAGLALVFPIYMLMTMLSAGALGGMVAGSVARALGRNEFVRADRIAWNSLLLATTVGIAISIFFSVSAESIFLWLGASRHSLEHALGYSSVLFTWAIAIWIFNVLTAILRGSGQMKLSAVITIAVVAIQIPLMGALILGWGGLIRLGLPGAPAAILSAFVVGIVAAVIGLSRKNSIVRLSRRGFRLDFPFLRGIAKSSAIAGISPLLTVTTVVVLTRFVGKFGDAALAGYGIGSRLEFLIIPLVFGIGTALTTLVGGNIGAGQLDRAHKVAWAGAGAAMVLAGVVGVFFALFPQAWANHFSKDSEVLASAHAFLQISGPGFPFLALGLALFFASQGANRVGWPVIAAFLRLVVIVAGANLLLTASSAGIETLYLLVFLGMVVYGSTNALAVWQGAWRSEENMSHRDVVANTSD